MIMDADSLAMHFDEVHPDNNEVQPECKLCLQESAINARMQEKFGEDFEICCLPDEHHIRVARWNTTVGSEGALEKLIEQKIAKRQERISMGLSAEDIEDDLDGDDDMEDIDRSMSLGRRKKPKRQFIMPAFRQATSIDSEYVQPVTECHWKCKLCNGDILAADISAGATKHYRTMHPDHLDAMQYELCKARLERVSNGCLEFVHPQLIECLLCNITYNLHKPFNMCRAVSHLKSKHLNLMPEYAGVSDGQPTSSPQVVQGISEQDGVQLHTLDSLEQQNGAYDIDISKMQQMTPADGEQFLPDGEELDSATTGMPSSIVESNFYDETPIFWLPNELLDRICTYITKISDKMVLEQVCKRIYFLTTGVVVQNDDTKLWPNQSPSWKGTHKLELMMKCINTTDIEMTGNCDNGSYLLNDCLIPFAKWPDAIKSLIQRTQIQQLIFHCGLHDEDDENLLVENPTVLARLTELFKESTNRMRIDDFEFHYGSLRDDTPGSGSGIDKIRSFLLDSLQMSSPYLKHLVLNVENRYIGNTPIWPVIHQCSKLKSIAFSDSAKIDYDALVGKPLTDVMFGEVVENFNSFDGIIQVLNGAQGDGVHSLSLNELYKIHLEPTAMDLKEFCDRLSENSRKKLKIITERNALAEIFKLFPLIPSMFPNLERLEIGNIEFESQNDLSEFFSNIASFLNFCNAEHRLLLINTVRLYDGDLQQFNGELSKVCDKANIPTWYNDDHYLQLIIFRKGNSQVRIIEVIGENNKHLFFNRAETEFILH